MFKGIAVNGASGAGKTTLGAELAKRLEFFFMDLDDYFINKDTGTQHSSNDEINKRIIEDISNHSGFVMSGSILGELKNELEPHIALIVLLFAPTEIRLNRVKARTTEEYGNRILPGGDMHDIAQTFYAEIKQLNPEKFELWASNFTCPVLRLDGTAPIEENVSCIISTLSGRSQNAK